MAWHVHFGGDKLPAINDATYEQIKDAIQTLSASEGGSALIGLKTSTETYELIWTIGAPIYFSYFDETADDIDDLDAELATLITSSSN